MRFPLTDEQRSIQKAVREFARGEFDDERILDLNAAGQYPRDLLKKACRLEFVGVCYPESCGGLSGSPLDQVLVIEELCRKDSSVGIALGMADTGAELIGALGRDDQKRQYLPRLAAGKMLTTAICIASPLSCPFSPSPPLPAKRDTSISTPSILSGVE